LGAATTRAAGAAFARLLPGALRLLGVARASRITRCGFSAGRSARTCRPP